MVKQFLSKEAAFNRIYKYCAYQERSHSEVRSKLLEWGQKGIELEEIISSLVEGDFLNEERFAIAFAGGKFRIKNWGINKIKSELNRKNVSDYCIKKAISLLPKSDYDIAIKKLIEKKEKSLVEKNIIKRKQKIANYLLSKGYESELVWKILSKKYSE
jgi:regulatory protein